jgi:iron complex transport system substrate-binding protein
LAVGAAVLVLAGCRQTSDRPSSGGVGNRSVDGPTRLVTDMRGVQVPVPTDLTRVATIDDGFIESVMTRFGTIRTLVAVGSSAQQRTWSYSYPVGSGSGFSVTDGMGTMRALHPWIENVPCASCTSGDAVSVETIAATKPQVVIVRVGDCTIGTSTENVERLAGVFDAMGLPVVVLRSPADYRGHGLETLREEIGVLGRVFGREEEAARLADELEAVEEEVRSRVGGAGSHRRPRALYLGLAPTAREAGGAAYVWGTESAESWMIEQIVGAENAYRGAGSRVLLNAEQILALDPDVIFLPTSAGYHPPRELAEASYFGELRRLRAVRDNRVYALPWTPMNCARRLEYPIDLLIMAKGAYPDRFRDISVHEWVLGFYRQVYGVDEAAARALRRAQWLDWTMEQRF